MFWVDLSPRESHPDSKISKATEKQPQQSAVHFFVFFFGQRGAPRKKEVVEEEVGEWGDNDDDADYSHHIIVRLILSHLNNDIYIYNDI